MGEINLIIELANIKEGHMARITVEDCLEHVENRFDLVLKAARRAHFLELGAVEPMVPIDNDKPTVVALREIAAGYDVTQEEVNEPESEEITKHKIVFFPESQPTDSEESINI